ncbi:glycerophosphodiester phosphodiesterase family protein [Pelagibacterium limicola]|uniref:glycerophosphodiester phosphodiesterase family protein n=1 Tax=Pelagibacterium limicola TaxID=2791022 RepID=UPI0018AFB828
MLRLLAILVIVAGAIWIWNASWRVPPSENPQIQLIAHRGVHHTFDRTGLENDTCTAERIAPPEHALFENTVPSMQAAFAAGADIVEIDVHPTTDGQFAIFHDWTLDCRTDGAGETRAHDMAYLKALDIGYGYTADDGKSFPLRGKGVGLMPSLEDVLSAMPDRRFLINFKSNEAREGDMLAILVAQHPEWAGAVWGAYGGDAPTFRAKASMPNLAVWSRRGLMDCLLQYMGYGWTGFVPSACRDTYVMVPINLAPWLWGWPKLFQKRLAEVGSEIILLGPYESGDPGTAGIDDLETLARVPAAFSGYIWTNRIERIGPAMSDR